MHAVGDSGAFQLGAQFLRTWRKNLKNVCIVSCQKGECRQFPPVCNLHSGPHFSAGEKWWLCRAMPILFLLLSSRQSVTLTLLSGISALPLSLRFHGPQLVGRVCVPTEQYGLIFQDMGFTVYEYSIWNPKELCSDPVLFFDVMEVKGSPLRIFSLYQPGLWPLARGPC